jgi:hypothetical protein
MENKKAQFSHHKDSQSVLFYLITAHFPQKSQHNK